MRIVRAWALVFFLLACSSPPPVVPSEPPTFVLVEIERGKFCGQRAVAGTFDSDVVYLRGEKGSSGNLVLVFVPKNQMKLLNEWCKNKNLDRNFTVGSRHDGLARFTVGSP